MHAVNILPFCDCVEENPENIPAFLQVGDWTYPLVARSPVLLTTDGLYVFPDPNAKVPGNLIAYITFIHKFWAANIMV